MKHSRYIVIVGCGRLGARLANRFSRDGHAVVAIDLDPSAFNNLSTDFSGFRLEGDAAHLAVLKEAKSAHADVLIAATGDDNVNLMVAQIARTIFSVSQVLARVFDPLREPLYAQLGIPAICPISLADERFVQALVGEPSGEAGERT